MKYLQRNFHKNGSRRGRPCSSRRRAGSVIVEFALVAPILILLLLGVVQYGLIAQATAVTTNLSREGARFGSLSSKKTDADIADHVRAMADSTSVRGEDISVAITPATRVVPLPVRVTVTYNMRSRFFLAGLPGISWMLNAYPKSAAGDPEYRATATMAVLSDN